MARIWLIALVMVLAIVFVNCAQVPSGAPHEDSTHFIGIPHMPSWHADLTYICWDCHNSPKPHYGEFTLDPKNFDPKNNVCLECHAITTTGKGGGIGKGKVRPIGHPSTSCLKCHKYAHNKFTENVCTACHDQNPEPAPPLSEGHNDSGCLTCHAGVHDGVWDSLEVTTTQCTKCHSAGSEGD